MPADTTLSYLVSTAGHAQQQNDLNPHTVRSILQLIDEGAEELQDEKVVGFTTVDKDGNWVCDRYCMLLEYLERWNWLTCSLQAVDIPLERLGQRSLPCRCLQAQGRQANHLHAMPHRSRLSHCVDRIDADRVRGGSHCASVPLKTSVPLGHAHIQSSMLSFSYRSSDPLFRIGSVGVPSQVHRPRSSGRRARPVYRTYPPPCTTLPRLSLACLFRSAQT